MATITPAGGAPLDVACLLDAVAPAGFEWLSATVEADGELRGGALLTPVLAAPLPVVADGTAGITPERLTALEGRRVHVHLARAPDRPGPGWTVRKIVEL